MFSISFLYFFHPELLDVFLPGERHFGDDSILFVTIFLFFCADSFHAV